MPHPVFEISIAYKKKTCNSKSLISEKTDFERGYKHFKNFSFIIICKEKYDARKKKK